MRRLQPLTKKNLTGHSAISPWYIVLFSAILFLSHLVHEPFGVHACACRGAVAVLKDVEEIFEVVLLDPQKHVPAAEQMVGASLPVVLKDVKKVFNVVLVDP